MIGHENGPVMVSTPFVDLWTPCEQTPDPQATSKSQTMLRQALIHARKALLWSRCFQVCGTIMRWDHECGTTPAACKNNASTLVD
ncbi:hypothetical protein ROHU_030552 [Labeo rohita]|uniref:Uncharacterized protein n=1 Tax=Labeo rohita TaxID=84645 RepID=A0A498LS00_LABRO|nr:hypothetical protein ROHU_030552 [Labeo rohita]